MVWVVGRRGFLSPTQFLASESESAKEWGQQELVNNILSGPVLSCLNQSGNRLELAHTGKIGNKNSLQKYNKGGGRERK